VKVLDKTSSGWMGKWKNYFEGLRIENLRSPMWFHPSPAEVDGLVGFAQREGREGERVVIEGVVGKELSKHARKSGLVPSLYTCVSSFRSELTMGIGEVRGRT
jgi:hypothetical protein